MIRRAFVRALSGAILTTLLGVRPWRLEEEEYETTEFVDEAPRWRVAYDATVRPMHARYTPGTIYLNPDDARTIGIRWD